MMKNYLLALAVLFSFTVNAQFFWTNQATNWPLNWGVNDISIVDENTVWISAYDGSGAGTYPKDVARTTNGGSDWVAMSVTGVPSTALIGDIAGVDANTAYVVTAPTGANASNNGIWKTTDGGSTWTKYSGSVFTGSAAFANHIYFWDADNGYAGGDPVSNMFQMYKTTDGGESWTQITSAPAPLNADEFTYTGLKDVVGDKIWLGTSLGRILYSPDRGETWEAYQSPATDFGGVITEGSTGTYAFADNGLDGLLITNDSGSVFLWRTNDGGENWELLDLSTDWYAGDVAAVPGTSGVFVTSGINALVATGTAYTTDFGDTWINIDSDDQRGTLAFLNGTTGWCGYFSDGPNGISGIWKFDGDLNMGTVEVTQSSLQVYPNPANGVVNFISDKEIQMINIIDMNGRNVLQTKNTQVDVSSLPAGIYIGQARLIDGRVQNTKIVVK